MYEVWVEQVASLGEVPGPEVFWMSHFEQWLPLNIYMLIVRGEGKTILVNCGPPVDYLPRMNEVWREELGERSQMTVAPAQRVEAIIARHGITPEDVDMVILTPLQAYALGNVDKFPRATIAISRIGWEDLLAPPFYDPRRHMAVPDRLLRYLLFDAWYEKRVRLLDKEENVLPGIRAVWLGTHHRSSIGIFIDTPRGVVAFTDTVFYYDNLEKDHPLGIQESMEECRIAYQRLRREATVVVSAYDPANQLRYPDGRVAVGR
ncbi:MAG: MBL fold metallo-hydrolase [Firmicutes bacterium]|nr:MBL fold metallo-hydrolase [Bacillota bacterium]